MDRLDAFAVIGMLLLLCGYVCGIGWLWSLVLLFVAFFVVMIIPNLKDQVEIKCW